MQKKIMIAFIALITIGVMASCGSNRCGSRKDCNGNKKSYNKSGGFWM